MDRHLPSGRASRRPRVAGGARGCRRRPSVASGRPCGVNAKGGKP